MNHTTNEWLASLKHGSLVRWNDPDNGIGSGTYMLDLIKTESETIESRGNQVLLLSTAGTLCEALVSELSPVVRERITLAVVVDYDCGTFDPTKLILNLQNNVRAHIQKGMLTEGTDASVECYGMRTIVNSQEPEATIPAAGPDYLSTLDTAIAHLEESLSAGDPYQGVTDLINDLRALREGPKPGQVNFVCQVPPPRVVIEHNGDTLQVTSSSPVEAVLVDYTYEENDDNPIIPEREGETAHVSRLDVTLGLTFCDQVVKLADEVGKAYQTDRTPEWLASLKAGSEVEWHDPFTWVGSEVRVIDSIVGDSGVVESLESEVRLVNPDGDPIVVQVRELSPLRG